MAMVFSTNTQAPEEMEIFEMFFRMKVSHKFKIPLFSCFIFQTLVVPFKDDGIMR